MYIELIISRTVGASIARTVIQYGVARECMLIPSQVNDLMVTLFNLCLTVDSHNLDKTCKSRTRNIVA